MSKKSKNVGGRPATGKDPMRSLRIDDETWDTIHKAADLAEVSTAEFVRRSALRSARRVIRRHEAGQLPKR